jgi:tetratricopeptide (TPR) repeat protein
MGDTLIYDTALLFFEAGRIHEELGNKDSVIHYYKKAYDVSPKNIDGTSRFLYSYARTIREDDAYKSDSLYEVLADNYALTEFGQDAMRKLGFTEEFIIDTVRDLFSSGMKNKSFGNYDYANKQFFKLFENYPNHKLAPRALYNIGWLYEHNLNNVDSAIYFYDIILKEYPNSEYAEELRLPIAQLKNRRYGDEIPDSLTYKAKYTETKPKNAIKGLPSSKTNKNNLKLPESLNQNSENNNLNLDPNKTFEESQDAINKPLEILKNIDIDDLNPMNLFNSEEEPEEEPEPETETEIAIPDSTKKK